MYICRIEVFAKMRKFLLSFLLLNIIISVVCAQQTTVIPASYTAGDASVAYSNAWLPFQNPAALGGAEKMGFLLLYENKYITKELSNKVVNAWLPTKYINIGVSFSHLGYSEYNEMLAALTFARKFGKFKLGVELDYYTLFLSQSKRYQGTLTAQVGMQVNLTEDFSLAFSAFNPVFSKVKSDLAEKRLPTVFSLGSLYKIRNTVDWYVQFDKEVSSPFRWATGFEYSPVKELIIRLGAYGYNSFVPTLGVGLRFDKFKFDISSAYSSTLGFSFLGAVGYGF